MNISDLHSLLAIENFKNISKAADYLGISQPALSRLVSSMESKLEIKLFTRLPRGVKVTKEGEIYFSQFKRMLNTLEQAKEQVQRLQYGELEHLSLSVHPVIGNYIIPKIEKGLMELQNIKNIYHFHTSRKSTEMVINGDVDLAIVADCKDYPELVKIKLWNEFIGLYSKNGKLSDRVYYYSKMIDAQKILRSLNVKEKKTIDHYEIINSIISHTPFMGILPNTIPDTHQNLKLIKKVRPSIEVFLVYRVDHSKTKLFKKFVRLIKTVSKV